MINSKSRLLLSETGKVEIEEKEKKAKDEINRITEKSSSRERAIYTIMRQSGLPISRIQKLKIGDLERILDPNPPTPCRINTPTKNPTFIGYEAVKYTKDYLDKRLDEDELTPKSLLFVATNNTKKEINTKSVSRTFRNNLRNSSGRELRSLTEFFKTNTKEYQKELKALGKEKGIEVCRELYKKEAMRNLEIELPTPMEMHRLESQNKELAQRLTEIAGILLPIESEISTMETGETRFEWFEEWLREHPEEKKRLEKWQQEEQKSHREYLKLCPEAKKIDKQIDARIKQFQKFYMEHLNHTVLELRDKMKDHGDMIKEHRKTRQKQAKYP